MKTMNVLIIEDEKLAQVELKRLLDQSDFDINVLGCLDSIEESVQWLAEHEEPDIIFMDIQLSDGSSFEIFDLIEIKTPVIFTTAYDEYAIQAFKVNSVDYLLKPIEPSDLQASLQKYTEIKQHYTSTQLSYTRNQIEQILDLREPHYKNRFISRIGDRIQHIMVEDVAYFYAEDKIVSLVTRDNKEFVIDYTLEHLQSLLDPNQFYRLNRKYLAKIDAIEHVLRLFDGRFKVILKPPAKNKILISRRRMAEFKRWLDS
jgi:two-component system response regulator LytT